MLTHRDIPTTVLATHESEVSAACLLVNFQSGAPVYFVSHKVGTGNFPYGLPTSDLGEAIELFNEIVSYLNG